MVIRFPLTDYQKSIPKSGIKLHSTRMHSSRMCTTRSSSHRGGGHLPQCMLRYTAPWVWAWRHPPWVWAWRPPGCWPEDPPGQTPQLPPGCETGNLQGMLGYHSPETCCKACWDATCNTCWDTTPSNVDRMTDMCKNITFA